MSVLRLRRALEGQVTGGDLVAAGQEAGGHVEPLAGGGLRRLVEGLPAVALGQEPLREIVSGRVARQSQAVMMSSRTKWRRITRGSRPSSE